MHDIEILLSEQTKLKFFTVEVMNDFTEEWSLCEITYAYEGDEYQNIIIWNLINGNNTYKYRFTISPDSYLWDLYGVSIDNNTVVKFYLMELDGTTEIYYLGEGQQVTYDLFFYDTKILKMVIEGTPNIEVILFFKGATLS